MKKYLLILTVLLGSLFSVKAQNDQPGDETQRQQKIEALYVAYVTQQLALTPDEAQKFWPLHTQFANELKGIRNDMTELEKEQARLNIKKKYQENFNRVIGPVRCERFFRMGDEFKRRLIEQRNQRQQNGRPKLRRGQ
jgi:Skp family chaperone for outer membrane proteins